MTHPNAIHYGTEVRPERVERLGLADAVAEMMDEAATVVPMSELLSRLDSAARGVGLRITVTIEPAP